MMHFLLLFLVALGDGQETPEVATAKWGFPPGVPFLVDEDHTCSTTLGKKWHEYRESFRLKFWLFKLSPTWRDDEGLQNVLQWWLSLVSNPQPQVIECPVGRLFVGSLALSMYPQEGSLKDFLVGASAVANLTIDNVLKSGWPLFSLFWHITHAEGYKDPSSTSDTPRTFDRDLLLQAFTANELPSEALIGSKAERILRNVRWHTELHVHIASLVQAVLLDRENSDLSAHYYNGKFNLLPSRINTAVSSLPVLAQLVPALLAPSSELSLALAVAQTLHVQQAICPEGTRLMQARPSPGIRPFRLCIRNNYLGLDAAASMEGDWDTCRHLRTWHREFVGPLPGDSAAEHAPTGKPSAGCVVVDIGSHVGLCSLAFAMQGCRVVAVDILDEHVRMVTASAIVNSLTEQITPVLSGMSNVTGWTSVQEAETNEAPQTTKIGLEMSKEQLTPESARGQGLVPLTTVDKLLENLGIPKESVTLLKVDAEGHDLEVLQGAVGVLSSGFGEISDARRLHVKPPLVVFEVEPTLPAKKQEMLEFLGAYGYSVTFVNNALNFATRLSY